MPPQAGLPAWWRADVPVVRDSELSAFVPPARCNCADWAALGQVFGGLAHLPVLVVQRPPERGVDLLAGKRREGDDGAPPNRRSIVGPGENCRQAPRVADRAEGGDRCLPAQGFLVAGGNGR